MRVPRVLLAAESLERRGSGIARVARLMARALADAARDGRLEVSALALSDSKPVRDLGVDVRTARGSRARFALEVHLRALRCDAVIYDFAGMARAHPRLWPKRPPYLVWMHGVDVWEGARADHLARLRAADVLVSPSRYSVERASTLHPGLGHARVCALATEEDDAPPPSERATRPNLLILARLDEAGGYKGHRELIACWPEVVRQVKDAQLVIAGGGPGAGVVREWVRASPVRDSIHVRGFVHERDLASSWTDASVFAMPSRGEGFGVTYVEAMRYGLPVVASQHDAAREVVVDGETGYLVDLDDPSALPRRIVELLGDPSLARTLGEAGRERWARLHRYSAFRTRFAPVLEAFLASARAG